MIQEREQSIPIFPESSLVSGLCHLGLERSSEDFLEKAVNCRSMFTEVASLQPKPVHGFDDQPQQGREPPGDVSDLLVERLLAKILD